MGMSNLSRAWVVSSVVAFSSLLASSSSAQSLNWSPSEGPAVTDPESETVSYVSYLGPVSCTIGSDPEFSDSVIPFCALAGSYTDSTSTTYGVVVAVSPDGTAIYQPADPSIEQDATASGVWDVSCAAGACALLGTFTYPEGREFFLDQYPDAGPTYAPVPSGNIGTASINAVACGTDGSCFAVGSYTVTGSSTANTLIETLSNGAWSAFSLGPGLLNSIACSNGNCLATGGNKGTPFVATRSAGAWEMEAVTLPSDILAPGTLPSQTAPYLVAAACPAGGDCVAVGGYENIDGWSRGMIAQASEEGGGWVAITAPLPSVVGNDALGTLSAVSCSLGGFCVAAGTLITTGVLGFVQLIETQDCTASSQTCGTWTASLGPVPAGTNVRASWGITSVSCVDPSTCWAVGHYSDMTNLDYGFIEQLAPATPYTQPAPLPPTADTTQQSYLSDIDCFSSTACVASGLYTDLDAGRVALIESTVLNITTGSLPTDALFDEDYLAVVATAGGVWPLSWSVVDGSLPNGLALYTAAADPELADNQASIEGAPTQTGTWSFTLQATDSSPTPMTAQRTYQIEVVSTEPDAGDEEDGGGEESDGGGGGGQPDAGAASDAGTTGLPASLTVHPPSVTIAPGGSTQFSAQVLDVNGNPIPSAQVTWSVVIAAAGTIDQMGNFTAGTVAGTYTNAIVATTGPSGSVQNTASVTISAGALSLLAITPESATLAAGDTVSFIASGFDGHGNAVAVTPTWSVLQGGGTMSASGEFTAGDAPGTFANTVQAAADGIAATASVTVTPGPVTVVAITPSQPTVAVGGTVQFSAQASDSFGNPISDPVTWSADATAGRITPNGVFTAGTSTGDFPAAVTATVDGVSSSTGVDISQGSGPGGGGSGGSNGGGSGGSGGGGGSSGGSGGASASNSKGCVQFPETGVFALAAAAWSLRRRRLARPARGASRWTSARRRRSAGLLFERIEKAP